MKQISIRAFVLVLTLAGIGSSVNAKLVNAKSSAVRPTSTIVPPCGPSCHLPD